MLYKNILVRKSVKDCLNLMKFKYCTENKPIAIVDLGNTLTIKKKLSKYFDSSPHLQEIRQYIPSKYLTKKTRSIPENIYLVDSEIAKDIVKRILPILQRRKQSLICETNAGLGLITSALLDNGVKRIRLYECCSEFRHTLKSFDEAYPGRVELFVKDLFHIERMEYVDKLDKGNRVQQLLGGLSTVQWTDDPVMTIIGPMPNLVFFKYLFKSFAMQSDIISHGRITIFAIMKPSDYVKLIAGPHLNLRFYKNCSIYFRTFFDCKLLAQYPRQAFLPWFKEKSDDADLMYLVEFNMKKQFQLETHEILPFYLFVKYFFKRPLAKVIPTVEKLLPGIGIYFIAPAHDSGKHIQDINIYTTFGQVTPEGMLALFKAMYNHPEYNNSSFVAMINSVLLKSETVESDIADAAPHVTEDLEEKLDEHA